MSISKADADYMIERRAIFEDWWDNNMSSLSKVEDSDKYKQAARLAWLAGAAFNKEKNTPPAPASSINILYYINGMYESYDGQYTKAEAELYTLLERIGAPDSLLETQILNKIDQLAKLSARREVIANARRVWQGLVLDAENVNQPEEIPEQVLPRVSAK